MKKIVTIIGARPQFIMAEAVSCLMQNLAEEVIVQTGQHYVDNLSDVFFDELEILSPKYHHGIGSGSHGAQTGEMLQVIEKVLIKECPKEIISGVVNIGDMMMEPQSFAIDRAEKQSNVLDELDLQHRNYYLVTIHRADNTLKAKRLGNILAAIAD